MKSNDNGHRAKPPQRASWAVAPQESRLARAGLLDRRGFFNLTLSGLAAFMVSRLFPFSRALPGAVSREFQREEERFGPAEFFGEAPAYEEAVPSHAEEEVRRREELWRFRREIEALIIEEEKSSWPKSALLRLRLRAKISLYKKRHKYESPWGTFIIS